MRLRYYWRLKRPMETHETQRDYWRPMGTHETQRDKWGHMRLRETTGDS